jgi:hypothetical protein
MEGSALTVHGEAVDRLADAFVEEKATQSERSLNKRGVRNIHRYGGDGFTHVTYERGAAHSDAWVVVSVLFERVDETTSTVVVLVGGGGEGPFKIEELTVTRLLQGDDSVGQAGRFATVLADVTGVCASLDLSVETTWEGDREPTTTAEKVVGHVLDG